MLFENGEKNDELPSSRLSDVVHPDRHDPCRSNLSARPASCVASSRLARGGSHEGPLEHISTSCRMARRRHGNLYRWILSTSIRPAHNSVRASHTHRSWCAGISDLAIDSPHC